MHIGFYNFYTVYNNNRMFRSPESVLGTNLAAPSVEMGSLLAAHGHHVSTVDTAPLDSYDAIVFLDYPTRVNRFFRAASQRGAPPLYLMLLENELIRPDNYWRRNHAAFRKIFTWHDGWVDGQRYIKVFNSVGWREPVRHDRLPRDQLCVTTAGNKFSTGKAELYSARRETLRWFAEHAPGDMALFGEGWDRWHIPNSGFVVNTMIDKAYRQWPGLPRQRPYSFWRGFAKDKAAVLETAKFSICYENAVLPGYITEKIFDCFFAGCVPVYHGAPNVSDYIPPATFIDRTQFASHHDLHAYLRGMSAAEYSGYRVAIADYLASDAAQLFGAKRLSNVFLEHIAGESLVAELPRANEPRH